MSADVLPLEEVDRLVARFRECALRDDPEARRERVLRDAAQRSINRWWSRRYAPGPTLTPLQLACAREGQR